MFTSRLTSRYAYVSRLLPWASIDQCSVRRYSNNVPRVAIVGAGPAGFYTAQNILKVRYKSVAYHVPEFSVNITCNECIFFLIANDGFTQ